MFSGLSASIQINFILVFIEGVVSFFSPCVLPLIPVYISYLAGGAKHSDENGVLTYQRKIVFLHTLFFVFGISLTFFILGFSFSALGSFFSDNKTLLSRAGGIVIVLLGLFQIGFFDFSFLQREQRFHFKLNVGNMNPFIAFLMGLTFSFSWTPCVGPALSSVLILTAGAKNTVTGVLLIGVYSLGFVIPFFLLGLFTTQALNLLKKHQALVKYSVKIGGVILILIGVMTFTGWMNGISGYLSSVSQPVPSVTSVSDTPTPAPSAEATPSATGDVIAAYDFTLTDQYGNSHTLSDYTGQVVFLNFWATWCGPCRTELPHIEELYNEYDLNAGEVVFLTISSPVTTQNPQGADGSIDEIKQFIDENGYTFPVLFDESGDVFYNYSISAFPTTFMIDKNGNIFGYISGSLTKDIMINIIDQTLESTP